MSGAHMYEVREPNPAAISFSAVNTLKNSLFRFHSTEAGARPKPAKASTVTR